MSSFFILKGFKTKNLNLKVVTNLYNEYIKTELIFACWRQVVDVFLSDRGLP